MIKKTLLAALIAAGVLMAYATEREPIPTVTITELEPLKIEPLEPCPLPGCGYIDFDANPDLIGGGIVYEPTN